MIEAMPFLPGLSPVAGKSLTACQDAGNLTSNGGLIILREAALRLGVADVVAAPLPDPRNPLLITHTYSAMVTARMMAICAGYEDADDLDALRHDPALLIACNRAPEGGHDIPSQPTISRIENVADVTSLYRIGIGYIDLFCRGYKTPPASIVLDIDDTKDMVRHSPVPAHHGGAVLRTDAAYWLLHSVRLAVPRKSRWRGATFETIRNVFVKIACRVEELKSRVKLSFPASLPNADALGLIAARLTTPFT